MPVSLVSSGVTFPDNTTQTTAASAVTAGNGISVSSGTVAVACPTFNSVGSYVFAIANQSSGTNTVASGSNYSAGSGTNQIASLILESNCGLQPDVTVNLSGTWKWMAAPRSGPRYFIGIACRVS